MGVETSGPSGRRDESELVNANQTTGLPVFLTPEEAADLLRTSRKAIYVRIERRQLPGVTRIGRRLLIRTEVLLKWLTDQECASSLQRSEQR